MDEANSKINHYLDIVQCKVQEIIWELDPDGINSEANSIKVFDKVFQQLEYAINVLHEEYLELKELQNNETN